MFAFMYNALNQYKYQICCYNLFGIKNEEQKCDSLLRNANSFWKLSVSGSGYLSVEIR